jgi:tetratricopeptide (TPR) repeat protein/DNA-binding XRE family transcriptional regulator
MCRPVDAEQTNGDRGQSFCDLLRELRGKAGLTQEDLADRSGLSLDAIGLLERGVRQNPRATTVALISDALGLSDAQRAALAAAARLRARARTPGAGSGPTSPGADALLASLPLETLPGPGHLPRGSRMPIGRSPLFVGRALDLRRIAAALRDGAAVALGQVIAATGMGGLGKTQLAIEFVHRYGRYFSGGVFWLSFANPEEIPLQVAACGGPGFMELRPGFSDLRIEEQLRLVRSAWESALPRLLVFDNCEDQALLARWRPPTGASRVLVTSRRSSWDRALGVKTVALDVLPRPDSVRLLRRFRPDLDQDDPHLARIARELGDLPLALHLAGSFLDRYRLDVSPEGYLAQLRGARLLEHASLSAPDVVDPSAPTGHLQGVARSFALSFGRLDGANDVDRAALALLARAACFAPGEPIARELLLAALPDADPGAVGVRADALTRLEALGLLERAQRGYRLHRLLAHFVRGVSADPRAQGSVDQVLITYGQQASFENLSVGYSLLAVTPHLAHVAGQALEHDEDARTAALCDALGRALHAGGDSAAARPYIDRAISIRERVLGPEHPDTASSLDWLATILWDRSELETARALRERALSIKERTLGPDHLDTAVSLVSLGISLQARGELAAARSHFERALEIRERALGPGHPLTAAVMGNLAVLLRDQGEMQKARTLMERALSIRMERLGLEHVDTATSLNDLALLLGDLGDLTSARRLHEQALSIRERLQGPEHPRTAQSLNNLARLLRDEGDLVGARALLERAVANWETSMGRDHALTAHALGNLGGVLLDLGELSAARAMHERALDIRERTMGPDNPRTAQSLVGLASVLQAQGELDAARRPLERALAIQRRALGADHPLTAVCLHRLGLLLGDLGEPADARTHLCQALAIRERVLGPGHPDTLASRAALDRLPANAESP